MWWKRNKWKAILPLALAAALAFAFWYGGGAPGLRGWTVSATPSPQASPPPSQAAAAKAASPSPSQTAEPIPSPAPTPAQPSAQPSAPAHSEEPPQATAEPSPEPERASCTVSIRCDALLDDLDALDEGKRNLVPGDGVILPPTAVAFEPGESAFDVLQRVCRDNHIHLEFSTTPVYGSVYIEGIQNLYEFDCGELSGWMYRVNGAYPDLSASGYALQDGDAVEWLYTCDQGRDIGNAWDPGG